MRKSKKIEKCLKCGRFLFAILKFARNGTRDNFCELFAKVFHRFRPRRHFFDGPNFFQILADSAAIRLVQKSSKSESSSRFFSHLKFRKSLPVYVLPKFPRQIQNRNGHISPCTYRHAGGAYNNIVNL